MDCVQVEDLARLSFKRNPLYVGIDDRQAEATREGLEQGYCIVPSAQRFLLLFTFLKKNASKKARAPRLCPCHVHAKPHVGGPVRRRVQLCLSQTSCQLSGLQIVGRTCMSKLRR